MGYRFFRESILSKERTLDAFVTGLLTLITCDRCSPPKKTYLTKHSNCDPISPHLLLSSLSILSTLDLYFPTFAHRLLLETQSYYHAEADSLSETLSPAAYIAHVDARLRQEEERCQRYFELGSKKEIMEVTEHELVGRIAEDILKRGFRGLVAEDDILSLRTLYRLLNLVEDIEIMRTAWGDYIKVQEPPQSIYRLSGSPFYPVFHIPFPYVSRPFYSLFHISSFPISFHPSLRYLDSELKSRNSEQTSS
jgi:cullin 4